MPVGTFRIVRYIVGVRYSGVSVKRGSTVYSTIDGSSAKAFKGIHSVLSFTQQLYKVLQIKAYTLNVEYSIYAQTHYYCVKKKLTGQTLPVNVMGLGTPLAMLVEPKLKSSSPTSPVVYLPSGQLPALSS